MKRIIFNFVLIVLLGATKVCAQLPIPTIVNDPINYAALGEVVLNTQMQLAKVEEQLAFAKRMQDKIDKVSSAVRTLELAEDVIITGERTINQINSVRELFKEVEGFSPEYVRSASNICLKTSKAIYSNLSFIGNVLGEGFSMSDAERIETMMENLESINTLSARIASLEKQTMRLKQKREILKTFQ